jgi:hypothetical protein
LYRDAIRDIRDFLGYVKLYGFAGVLGAIYVAITVGLQQGAAALLVYVFGLGLMYVSRREHLKGGLLDKFDQITSSFEKIAGSVSKPY